MLARLWGHLSRRRQKQFLLLQIFIVFASFFEMLSLGAVVPFLSVLATPENVMQSSYMRPVISYFEITDPSALTLPLTMVFMSLIIFSTLIRIILLWAMTRLSYTTGADLCINIYRYTLYQDYAVHVSRNSSEVINGIITKTKTVTSGVIYPVLNLISSIVMVLGIVIVLLFVNISATLIAFVGFGGLYLILMLVARIFLDANSKLIAQRSDAMVKALQEGLEGIRDVLINSSQEFYTQLYKKPDLSMRRASWRNDIIVASPRLGMEAIGILVIAIFAQLATVKLGGIEEILPQLGVFVLGAQKLLPALQKGYGSYSRIKGSAYSLRDVIELLDQSIPESVEYPDPSAISFRESIKLKNLSFRYSEHSPWILKNVQLEIPKGSVVGIVGATGCGKSTLVDILMGLLTPSGGSLLVDERQINDSNKRAWQRHIASVPQHIYLSDGTLEENIAFGVPNEEVDHFRVEKAAQLAQIAEVIEGWDDGYQTLVGERGARLSGGQRQRVGIARAFYNPSAVLFLDEATSSLDDTTEKAVMDAINGLNKEVTIIIIAHRLTTLQSCDQIFKFGMNHQIQVLSYEELTGLDLLPTNAPAE